MSIDFHADKNKYTYASRNADRGWADIITALIDPVGKRVADIGCGGGIYTQAWQALGTQSVVGVDYSAAMVAAAQEKATGIPGVRFQIGSAVQTGLPEASADILFERALIHHLEDYRDAFAEAARVLTPGGTVVLQDRTPTDVALAGSPTHIRGYFFECFPKLLVFEGSRRPTDERVRRALSEAGFVNVRTQTLWEVRKVHAQFSDLENDLRRRTGRSILHELKDSELEQLIAYIRERADTGGAVKESDQWTIWVADKG